MRVMVWNVWWRCGGNWREREEGISATLATYRPDVLGLVDSWSGEGTDQPHRLAAPGGLHAAWAPSTVPPAEDPDQPGIDCGNGLLSRWPIVAVESLRLSGREKNAALLAVLDHPRGPLHVLVAAGSGRCRELAATATDERRDGALPVLLLADLNAERPDSMADLSPAAGAVPHVFARPGRPGQHLPAHGSFVAGDRPIEGVYPSSHCAVGVDLEL